MAGGAGAGLAAGQARADEQTMSQDTLRTGWDQHEPGLTPAQVSSSRFGRQFSTAVDGQVYAQPLVVGSTVIAATENDKVYGIDAATGAVHWTRTLGSPWAASNIGCGDLAPNLGVTGTPVYDPSTGTVYVAAKVNDPDGAHPGWYLHAIDPGSGAERSGWPVRIHGAPTNDPSRPFNPTTVNERPGLLLLGGHVYAGFGSECDIPSYVGYIAGVNTSTRALTLWAAENSAANGMAGIWQGGGGLLSDGPGRIIFTTGNGLAPAPGPGSRPPGQLSESVIRLGVNSDGSLHAQDFFSPANAPTLDQDDTDLGSGGPLGLPDVPFGAAKAHPHLLVQVGKDGRIFLLDRDNLGGRAQGHGGGDAVLGVSGPFQGVWGHPGAYGGQGGYVYLVGSRGPLRALAFGLDGSGKPVLTPTATSQENFGYTSGSPVVTSDGTTTGSATVWAEYADGTNGANGQLRAYDAMPSGGRMRLLFSAPIGTTAKFAVPATSGGRVYVGTRDGHVLAFGLPADSALIGPSANVGDVAVNSTGRATLTVTATRTVTVDTVSTPAGSPFTAAPTGLPKTLTAGQTFAVPLNFAPKQPGPAGAVVNIGTNLATIGFGVSGYGIQPGFTAFPALLDFGQVATGTVRTLGVTVTNTGSGDEKVTSTTAPTAPFSAAGVPADGLVVGSKQSVNVQVTYAPTASSNGDTGSLSVVGADGAATIALSGSAVQGASHLTITPTGTSYGTVPVGTSKTLTFDISNTGNIPLTITKAAAPAAPFLASNPISEGQQLQPGDVVHQAVTFSPTSTGTFTGVYQITSDDGRGPQPETLTATASLPSGRIVVPNPGAGGWRLNGSTQLSGGDLDLTQALNWQAGSAVFPVPVLTNGLNATFTAVLGGGNGADGMTFALLDPARVTPTSVGVAGGSLGWAPMPGVAVTLDTFRNTGDPSGNFVGLATGSNANGLVYAATSTAVPNLRGGPHVVNVSVAARTVTVQVDGVKLFATAVASLPPAAYLAFTGGTGGANDIHTVRDAAITAASYAVPPPGPNGWVRNGAAVMNGTTLVLNPAKPQQVGSAFQATAVPSAHLSASFTATLGGGTGGDGMTFGMLDASKRGANSIGLGGGGLGWQGLPGVAVTLDTFKNPGDPSGNFVAITVGTTGGHLAYVATSTAVTRLRSGPITVQVTVSGGHVIVTIQGNPVIDKAVTLPADVRVGFTGASGGKTDVHAVSGVTIRY